MMTLINISKTILKKFRENFVNEIIVERKL